MERCYGRLRCSMEGRVLPGARNQREALAHRSRNHRVRSLQSLNEPNKREARVDERSAISAPSAVLRTEDPLVMVQQLPRKQERIDGDAKLGNQSVG